MDPRKTVLYSQVLFFYFLIFFFNLLFSLPNQIVQVIKFGDTTFQEFRAGMPHSIILEKVSYESDVPLSELEFNYLVDLKDHQIVPIEKIEDAVSALKKKNRFETVELAITLLGENRYQIHFKCSGFWAFHKVKFDGVFLRKETYRHLYAMEQGEQFDMQKNNHYLKIIQDALIADGYLSAEVKSYQTFDHREKLVIPVVCILPHSLFLINDVHVEFDQLGIDDEHRLMANKIERRCKKKLAGGAYCQKLMNEETQKIKEYLAKKGYLNPRIELHKAVNSDQYTVNIVFKLNVSNQRRFIFFGNQFFGKRELVEHCLTFGRSADIVPVSIISQDLNERYHEKGFWQSHIDVQFDKNNVYFLINEGQRSYINSLNIKGAVAFDEQWLRKKFFKQFKKKQR